MKIARMRAGRVKGMHGVLCRCVHGFCGKIARGWRRWLAEAVGLGLLWKTVVRGEDSLLWWKTVSFEGSPRCGKVKCFVPLFLARDGDSGSVRSGSCEEIRSYEGISSYGLPFLLSFPLSSLSLFFFPS